MFHLYVPEVGRRHNMTLYRKSNHYAFLQNALVASGHQYFLFGDDPYILRPWLHTAFAPVGATIAQSAYNTSVSAGRDAMEWMYKSLKNMLISQECERHQKVLSSQYTRCKRLRLYCGSSRRA